MFQSDTFQPSPIGQFAVGAIEPAGEARTFYRAPGPAFATVLAGVVGAAALVGLGWSGRADMSSAYVAASGVALVGGALGAWTRRRRSQPSQTSTAAGPAADRIGDAGEPPYALALELAPNPVMLVTADEPDDLASRRISFANASARELLRAPREGALLVAALRHPDVLEAIDESLFGGLERTSAYETGGAHNRHWRVWSKPLPTSPPQPTMALVIMRDETDVVLNERRRSDFLANASHELRTPLASLTGFIETLRGHARDDSAARERFLAIMSRQADRMARLIDDLLSLSRIELNEHVRPSEVCDLAAAMADIADALAPQLAAKDVTLTLRSPPQPGGAPVKGDRDQLLQVAQNLLDNAIKYSPAGGRVDVEVERGLSLEAASTSRADTTRLAEQDGGRMSLLTPTWAEGARYALLRVSDAGPGMSREHLPRLTERFYRVEGQKSGTGLGLAIVKHIVNRHRGGFYVESAPGRGSVFGVYLPQAPEIDGAREAKLS